MMRLPVLLVILSIFAGAAATDAEDEARRIEGLLMAPCCGSTTLAEHHSGQAQQMKREIRGFLAAGWSRQEILDHYIAEYGETILSMPPARGFNLLAYLLPLAALLLGPVLLWRFLRRKRPQEAPAGALPVDVDPEYRERIERELRSL
jgi:cytochrome c-type biogenesis protein CcmH